MAMIERLRFSLGPDWLNFLPIVGVREWGAIGGCSVQTSKLSDHNFEGVDFWRERRMKIRNVRSAALLLSFLALASMLASRAQAQQTLGGITGTVTDTSGAVISGATVTLVGDQTKLNRTQTTTNTGSYLFVNLPIGTYTLSFTQQGFQSENIPSIVVQANRTATVNAELKIGNVSESITVEETPLINMVDTTNGYVMDKLEIDSVPLSTSSFTGLVTLSAGVNTELQSGSGANEGLGNAPIWANGQRDTSNSFLLNGVDRSEERRV